MFSSKKWMTLIALMAIAAMILPACAPPAAIVVEKEVPVEVEVIKQVEVIKEVPVEVEKEVVVEKDVVRTVEVIKEVEVEKEVIKEVEKEVEVVVTATPEPVTVSKGGTIIEGTFADAMYLNPIMHTDNASSKVNSMLYDGLTEINPEDLTSLPELAERWEVSDDSLTFTFYLRDDVTFHDGEPFTADDVKFTYEAILNEDINSIRRSDIADILTPEQIVVLDDYTIQFQLSQVDAAFLCCKTTYGTLPEHILGELTPDEFNASEFNTLAPVGTGPYMFREWVKDDHVALVKNPNYFQGEPNFDFWYLKVVEDAIVEFAQLQTGEVDISENVDSSLWEEAVQQEHLECIPHARFGFTMYTYQLDPEKTPLFLDVRTRQALLYALDRQALVDSLVFGLGRVAHSTMPELSWAFNPDNEPRYEFDPEKAKELLDEAGWKDEDGDGVREAHGVTGVEDGTPFSFVLNTNAGNTEREGVIVAAQQYWAEIGVDAQPTPIEWNALLAMLTETYEYEMIVVGFGWDTDPDQKTMWHTDSYGGGFNMNTYSNQRVDEVIDAALLTVDLEERKEYYYEMQQILAEEVPAAILYFKDGTGCYNKRVHEVNINDFNIYYNAHEMWVER